MASWIKISHEYKLKVGEELLATFSDWPDGIGTVYRCSEVTNNNFTITQQRVITASGVTEIEEDQRQTFVIPFAMLPIVNLHRKFRMGYD